MGFQGNQYDQLASIELKLDKFFDAMNAKIVGQDENHKRMEMKFN